MSRTYKFAMIVAVFVLLASAVATVAGMQNGLISTALLFLLPALWMLWIACACLETKRSILQPFLLWVVIDVAALVLLNLVISNARNATGPSGDDVAYVIAFSPLNWPIMLLSGYLPNGFAAAIPRLFSALPGIRPAIADWLSMSLLAALPSLLVIGIARLWGGRQSRNPEERSAFRNPRPGTK